MTIKQIKEEMLAYKDFFGGDLLYIDKVKTAKTKADLAFIIENHRAHMECMLNDAHSHLDEFKKKVGLSWC